MDHAISSAVPSFHGYTVRQAVWTISGRCFDLIWPADIDAVLDLPRTAEQFARDEHMPYWAQPWPASFLLAERILAGDVGAGRPAIEIGCGLGLVSIAATMMGWSVRATDFDDHAVAFASANAQRNQLTFTAAGVLDYRTPLQTAGYERVFASDVLYERRFAEPVARFLASALLPVGEAWLSDPNRSAADDFPECLIRFGLTADVEPVETTTPAGLLTRGRIWRVRRASD